DGAYGGLFRLCPEGASRLEGMDAADSVVVDPHKTMFLPYGGGAVLLKDGALLPKSFDMEANYLQKAKEPPEEQSLGRISPELTRPFRALRLWLPLQLAGVGAFRAALSEKLLLAAYFHEQLQRIQDFEVVAKAPDLSIVTYRYKPAGIA